ncbi:MAG: glucose-6-phosphate isomerase [Deltaproteobacteria bacterium]
MADLWHSYRDRLFTHRALGFALDLSRMDLPADLYETQAAPIAAAFRAMEALEQGALANPDEGRMVGHYWLRDSARAPTPELRSAVDDALASILRFRDQVRSGEVRPERAERFRGVLIVGIGGSALGPQFVSASLTRGPALDAARVFFFDNTDPDGMDRTLAAIGDDLASTLTVVISKSGGTKETRNGMLEARRAYERAGLTFAKHAVAVTGDGSELDRYAQGEKWLSRFPMWDWVGGRTSVLSAVGLLPAALQGIDVEAMLRGARDMDAVTRVSDVRQNPAMQLALAWWVATNGKGEKDMVVLPYKDRLELFSRYLQQLVMESLGKEKDLAGRVVHQGIAVYGNKGSTDQHAYVQQLRDGVNNFFVTFIEVLHDRDGAPFEVEPGTTSGDYLLGFLEGTRRALYESGRTSLTLTLDRVDAGSIGGLVALYERAVGFYASIVGVNAYHQPGVEAGKKAAATVLALQGKLVAVIRAGGSHTAEQAARAAGSDDPETAWKILRHLAANSGRGVVLEGDAGDPARATFRAG